MRVHFSIDRVVVDGINLSPIERAQLEESLRVSLQETLLMRIADAQRQSGLLPITRHSRRERLELGAHGPFASEHLGEALGTTLAGHVWGGTHRYSR